MTTRTRFAPSPTGDLHLGGAWTALASWTLARSRGGEFLLRVEDIDRPRAVAGAADAIQRDLRWLGLDWDEAPTVQSERHAHYESALATLASRGLVYPCDCSRAEVANVASAPHAGEESVYPGTCRDRDPNRPMRRPPALRVRVPEGAVTYEDDVAGTITQDLARIVGDFVLRRGDGMFAYQLAVVVDDLAMRVTDVLRGADLLASTPRQLWLIGALGAKPPRYAHLPLVVDGQGLRVQKRTRGATVTELRAAGVSAPTIVGTLAHGLGLAPTSAPASAEEIGRACAGREIAWVRDPWPIPSSLLLKAGASIAEPRRLLPT
ncbi:MAG: tRNA glutamyl-Q(34) synthetase GluQRS [Myxococcota bacterium]|nr:tRNA glutamyl-Q(34) synthetase GluQRS [Myxococcota bacterium]